MSYNAIVAPIHIRPIDGLDNLVLGTVSGYHVLVNKDTLDGSLVAFYEQGGQLSEEFCKVHDLVRRKNDDGTPAGGHFEDNRRVRAVKMRGIKSEGFAVPLSYFEYTGVDISTLTSGYQFDELNGHPICKKYFTPQTLKAQRANAGANNQRKDNSMFAKHMDTEQFKRGVGHIPQGSLIYITEKLHGMSGRTARVIEKTEVVLSKPRKLLAKVIAKLGFSVMVDDYTKKDWVYLNGSRNVVLADIQGDYHGTEDFRRSAVKGLTLHKGEVIYYELVGYTESGAPIMATQDTGALKDKAIEKKFGKTVTYSYGQDESTTGLYVYRITQVNEDGHVVELSWNQVVKRCFELGIKTVPLLHVGFYTPESDNWESMFTPTAVVVNNLTEGDGTLLTSTLCDTHPREGVVVRYESEFGTGFLKNKSVTFGMLEGYLKEKDDYVDAEEIA